LKKKIIVALTALLMLSLMFTGTISTARAQAPVTGPYVDQLTFFATTDSSKALGDVSAGLTDIYLWRVPVALRAKAAADPNVQTVTGFGGYLSLVLNPAPTKAFNPFSIKAVRQAMQYLIDRDYIVNVIHEGDASPKILCYGRYDADYAYVADIAEALLTKYAYSFDQANTTVTSALIAAGATRGADGKWSMNGSPITINGFIRIDDPIRKSIGDLLAADLTKLGFTVNYIYGDLTKAYDVVYGSDPMDGDWSFYTEGWRASALIKYDTGELPQMYCPFYGYMPGWQQTGWWQYTNATLDTLGEKFAAGNFTGLDDRASIMRQVLEMGFQESVRIFIADQLELYPASSKFPPFAYELAVADASPFTFYTIKLPEGDPARRSDGTGGSLKVAQFQMYQGAYNPIGGFSDVYSVNEWNLISDSGVWPDPHTGVPIPMRAAFSVQTSGPTGKLSVPSDTETYDYVHHKWTTVGEGAQAVSEVTFNYKLSDWHDGVMMTPADVRYGVYMSLEWSTQGAEGANDTRFDSTYAAAETTWVQDFVGIKFLNASAVQVYTNYWFPDDSQIASFSDVFPKVPWEVLYDSERVVLADQARYSQAEAQAVALPWLDFAAPNAGLPQMKANLTQIMASNLLPPAGVNSSTGQPLPYFDAGNRTLRYGALQAWVTTHNNFLVSNGPFYFDSTDRVAGQDVLKAFRDPTYPFKPGDWNYLIPVNVPSVSAEVPSSIEIGKDALVNVKVAVGGVPSSAADVVYLVFDSASNVVLSGRATPTSIAGTFEVALTANQTSTFSPGGYSIKIIAYSRSVTIPKFDSEVFTALPPYDEIIGAEITKLSSDVAIVTSHVGDLGTTTSDIQSTVTSLKNTVATLSLVLYIALVLLIASIVVSAVVIFYVRKKK
jgi:peptide/nickel transport system substrate-binding protein